jgi:hypothetical protein
MSKLFGEMREGIVLPRNVSSGGLCAALRNAIAAAEANVHAMASVLAGSAPASWADADLNGLKTAARRELGAINAVD